MFDERVSAPEDPGVYGWLLGFRSLPDANGRLIDAATGVLMVLVEHRGFTAIAITLSHCPCAQPAPITVLCLVDEGVDIVPDVPLPKPRPRAHARRRRSRAVTRGKSADPDGDGPSRSCTAIGPRAPPCRASADAYLQLASNREKFR